MCMSMNHQGLFLLKLPYLEAIKLERIKESIGDLAVNPQHDMISFFPVPQ